MIIGCGEREMRGVGVEGIRDVIGGMSTSAMSVGVVGGRTIGGKNIGVISLQDYCHHITVNRYI